MTLRAFVFQKSVAAKEVVSYISWMSKKLHFTTPSDSQQTKESQTLL